MFSGNYMSLSENLMTDERLSNCHLDTLGFGWSPPPPPLKKNYMYSILKIEDNCGKLKRIKVSEHNCTVVY